MEQERNELYEQLVSVVGEVRHRSEMRNIVLEGRLEQVSEQLEKREAVLSEVLAATNMDPKSVEQVTRQLEVRLHSIRRREVTHPLNMHIYEERQSQKVSKKGGVSHFTPGIRCVTPAPPDTTASFI